MEENVIKELDTLKGMLNNWKRGFLSWASPDGDNEYVLLEFTEEIQQQLYPYVTRLLEARTSQPIRGQRVHGLLLRPG